MALYELADAEFKDLRDLIQRLFGIDLSDDKRELVMNRLQPVLRNRGLPSFRAYIDFLAKSPGAEATSELIDRMSTNHTYFNREPAHFEFFRDEVLPDIVGRARAPQEKDLRVWCAAAATGEEPYTLVMMMLEALGADYSGWKAGLLATDLSSDALAKAESAIYPEEAVAELSTNLQRDYFEPAANGKRRVCARVRNEVSYRRLNLIQSRYAFKSPFHVIFCRNVMIYFDTDTKRDVTKRLYDVTAEGGYLFVGHAESLNRQTCPYEYIRPGVYRRGSAWS